jgi:hypothetical protein
LPGSEAIVVVSRTRVLYDNMLRADAGLKEIRECMSGVESDEFGVESIAVELDLLYVSFNQRYYYKVCLHSGRD